jgi:hypothetical protein
VVRRNIQQNTIIRKINGNVTIEDCPLFNEQNMMYLTFCLTCLDNEGTNRNEGYVECGRINNDRT